MRRTPVIVRALLWTGVLLRIAIAVWNGYFGPSPGADGDAAGFHEIAVAFSRNLETDRFIFGVLYAYALGVFYWATTPSLFLGSALSAMAWWWSARVLLRIMRMLTFTTGQQARVMLLYALFPSAVLWTGVTMREAYQLLLVNLAVSAALRIYLARSRVAWLWLFVAVACGALLQPGVFGFGVFLIIATATWVVLRSRRRIPIERLVVIVPFAAIVLWYGLTVFTTMYGGFGLERGLSAAIASYQQGGLAIGARTNYKGGVALSGPADLLVFIPVSFFQYLFEPLPWRVTAVGDLLIVAENAVRAWLLGVALLGLWRMPSQRRRTVLLVFLAWVVLEGMFALGTFNWGTAARHHIPGMGLLLVVAFARPKRRGVRRRRAPQAPPAVATAA